MTYLDLSPSSRPLLLTLVASALAAVLLSVGACGSAVNPAYCSSDEDCRGGTCDPGTNSCVASACAESNECPSGAPVCESDTRECRPCQDDGECAARDPGAPWCQAGACVECVTDEQCGGDTPVCEMGQCRMCGSNQECAAQSEDTPVCLRSGLCAECESDGDCGERNPVCGEDHTCQPCESGSQCSSGVCQPSGECALPAEVVHVASEGFDTSTCGDDGAPCKTIAFAATRTSSTRPWVRVHPGAYSEDTIEVAGDSLKLFVDPEALVTGTQQDLFKVGQSAALTVRGGHFTNPGGYPFDCADGTLSLDGVDISDAVGGVWSISCHLDVTRSTIRFADYGVYTHDSTGTFERNTVSQCHTTPVTLDGTFDCRNNLIVDNGPAIDVAMFFTVNGPSTFAFNTIANNQYEDDTSNALYCALRDPSSTAVGNLLWDDLSHLLSPYGDCPMQYSDLRGVSPSGTNLSVAPLFVSMADGDYRLAEGSPLIDLVPGIDGDLDLLGTARPAGAGADVGAYEHPSP